MDRSRDRLDVESPAEAHAALAGLAIEREHALAAYRPIGAHRIHELSEGIGRAIEACRNDALPGLIIDLRGLAPLPRATSVDRFLMVEEWAGHAHGRVAVAFVVVEPVVAPPSFVRKAAVEFGLRAEMFGNEREARAWLEGLRSP